MIEIESIKNLQLVDPESDFVIGTVVTLCKSKDIGLVLEIVDEYQVRVLWPGASPSKTGFMFPAVRGVFPSLRAQNLVSIQPMTLPSASIFYLDYKYGDGPLIPTQIIDIGTFDDEEDK